MHLQSCYAKAKHIVVADGSAPYRSLIKVAFGSEGGWYNITEAEHYRAALSLLRAYKVHLLILADEIDGVSGIDVVHQIRSGQAGCKPDIPIIVLTDPKGIASLGAALHDEAMAAGATACVSKPLSIKQLAPPIFSVLHHHQAIGAVRDQKRNRVSGAEYL
ncbi:MAG TPA: response regulator [Rhodospirillaceae bacterium]|nr:response regulator [Rhodospirillaceae bacterium]